jgi:hypothetical protein
MLRLPHTSTPSRSALPIAVWPAKIDFWPLSRWWANCRWPHQLCRCTSPDGCGDQRKGIVAAGGQECSVGGRLNSCHEGTPLLAALGVVSKGLHLDKGSNPAASVFSGERAIGFTKFRIVMGQRHHFCGWIGIHFGIIYQDLS